MSTEPTKEAAFFSTIRSWGIVRSDQRVFGGVLSGVGARIGMAAAPTRILFVLLALFSGGLAALAYAAAWALLPDSEGRIIIQDFGRGTPNVGALVAIGVLTLLGFMGLDNWGPSNWWGAWSNFDSGFLGNSGNMLPRMFVFGAVLIPLAIIGGIVWVIVWSVRQGRSDERASQGFARLPDGTIPQPAASASPVADAGDGGVDPAPAAPASDVPAAAAPAVAVATLAVPEPPAAPVATTPAPPVYSAPPTSYAPKQRVPGPGKFGYLAALAFIPLSAAITLYLHSTDQLAVFHAVAMGVIWTAGLGLILVINALRGRKAGFLGFVSFMALIPLGFTIAYADEIHNEFMDGSRNWFQWDQIAYEESAPEPIYTPPPPFDPEQAFPDFETVAIQGTCYGTEDPTAPEANGTVSLSSVPADQTITVGSAYTRLVIPEGTSIKVINSGGNDGMASASVTWAERDVTCDVNTVGAPAIDLNNADAPVLTVLLDDTQTDGYMNLWIEEN